MACTSVCFICTEELDNGTLLKTVKQKGIKTLIRKSRERGDNKWQCLEKLSEVQVHELCRMNYNLSKRCKPPVEVSCQTSFDFRTQCFLCNKKWLPGNKSARLVSTDKLQKRIESVIEARNDEWSNRVGIRISGKPLMENQARYHTSCYTKFVWMSTHQSVGRPKIPGLETAFAGVCRYIEENNDCPFTLQELLDKMEGFTTTPNTLKQKLMNKYADDIVMIEKKCQGTIVCFRNAAYKILMDSWHQKKASNDKREERLRVIRSAADIIHEDVRSRVYNTTCYPLSGDLLYNIDDDIPETLRTLLDKVLFKRKKKKGDKLATKRDSIAHSIISVVRPRSFISSIQLITGVYLSRKFGSRVIIDVLNSLGFCASYTNIRLFEASAMMHAGASDHATHRVLTDFESSIRKHMDGVVDEEKPELTIIQEDDCQEADEPSTSKNHV